MKKTTFLASLSLCMAVLAGCVKGNDAQTEPIDEGTRTVYDLPVANWWDYSEETYPGLTNFKFYFTNITAEPFTGIEIGLDFVFNPYLVDNNVPFFTIPLESGMYTLGAYDPNNIPVDGMVVLGPDTYAAEFIDRQLVSLNPITGGYVFIFPSMTEGQFDMAAMLEFGGATHTVNHTGYMMYDNPGYDGFGMYDVLGTPRYPAVASIEIWESRIGMIGHTGIYGTTNAFNMSGISHLLEGTATGDLLFDMQLPIEYDKVKNVNITGGCLIFKDGNPWSWLSGDNVELEWDANRETLSFPTTLPFITGTHPITGKLIVEDLDVVFGIVGRDPNTGDILHSYGQMYYGVVMIEQPVPYTGPAMLPAPAGVTSFAQHSSMMAPATRAAIPQSVTELTPIKTSITRTVTIAK